ncbi:SDR family NAD(P)-dependent oxidoreductase [Paenibacillus glucanolyticus]|uniref:SDR family NAD(P)-dependent oxidoreductase n=1 Tax=Paenibacillus sp. LBL TaxID=2940563 RepID=UPI0024735592|nr:SDR family oxidoreductase [Paenibacillus sp. LBL]MDH6672108.1 3-oxoacyl-[acyl-carrier protein] reductase [Paenibacillus sp. LBL]
MDLGLKDKVVLITGGTRGIGLETAVTFALEGAKVAICARDEEQLAAAAEHIRDSSGFQALTITADVTQSEECLTAVRDTVQHFGRLDILVNNAGTAAAKPFELIEDEQWASDLDLKLFGAIRFSRAAIPHIRKSGGGAIINVTTSWAKTPPASSMPSSVSRAAGQAMTKAMSHDLASDQIRVNTVCIGMIRSAQLEERWKREEPGLSWEQYARDPRHKIPLGRIGDTDEAAKVIVFLASDAASYVTGTSINIDGGSAPSL